MSVEQLIKKQINTRQLYELNLKINAYKPYEIEALKEAIRGIEDRVNIESIMVGDSYFTTHLGRESTKLEGDEEKIWGFNCLIDLLKNIKPTIDELFSEAYLVADMPDGACKDADTTLSSAKTMKEAGADVIKLEISKPTDLSKIKLLSDAGYIVMGHIGYTPQTTQIKRYGNSYHEALGIFNLAKSVRENGAKALVLEMVDEAISHSLSKNAADAEMQLYSIFSGRSNYGGQCVNIWDAVVLKEKIKKFFPSTASLTYSSYERGFYTADLISNKLKELFFQMLNKQFPLSPKSKLGDDEKKKILNTNPWI